MLRVNSDDLEIDYGDGDVYLWQGKPFTGLAYEMHPDGSLWSEVEYVAGREHGLARDWFPSGQLQGETSYYRGKYFGPDREWDAQGQLRSEIVYEYSYPLRERTWDAAGRLMSNKHLEQDPVKYCRLEENRAAYDQYLTINKEEWLSR